MSRSRKTIRFGVIGLGLMGREFASAAARWCHLLNLDFVPQITGHLRYQFSVIELV